MVEYCEPKSPVSVSALLDEIEANFSPGGTTMKRKERESGQEGARLKLQIEIPDNTTHTHHVSKGHQADFIADELATLMCDVTSGEEGVQEPAQSQDKDVLPSGRASSRGSSLWSSSHSSSSAYSASTRHSSSTQKMEHLGRAPDDDGSSQESDFQEARVLSLQPREVVLACNESINDDDFDEEYELQQARLISMQAPELVLRGNDSAVDFDEEYDLQEARALSLQPQELVCGFNDSMVDFDEEYDFQEARALSMQPREVVMAINDSVDFDEEFDIQEARALSMQPSELALAWGGSRAR
mmetsp:Transcript_9966/g.16606  ORF Transcript_9966/g.16606 Transcript_9966/m.16606 type:complete len:299 (-) Transcript_9966:95-991(-)